MLDLFGHVAYALLFGGMFLVTKKLRAGWAIKGAGDVIWVAIGWQLGMTSIVMWGVGFVMMDALGWWRWRKNADKDKKC